MTLELNNAGSFEFTIISSHPAISQIRKMKSQISVYHGDEEIFCGRVIEVKEDFYKRQKIFCEGELAYLNDSVQRPKKYQRMTVRGYLESLLSVHNAQVEDSKKFQVGAVTVTDPNDSIYRYTNWEKTMDVIKSDLIKSLGGYLFVRKENGIRYIDYLAELPTKSTQTVEFGKNLLDFTKNFDVTDLATAIIPLGAKINSSDTSDNPSVLEERLTIKDINNGNDFLFNQEAVNNYGWIFKTVIWDNVNTTTALKRKGEQYLASAQFENMTIEAKAIDMNFVDGSERLKLGELIRVVSVPHGLDKFFPLSKMTILLDKISQNTITLGLEVKTSLTSSNISTNDKIQQEIEKIPSHSDIVQEAVDNATQIINQKTTGYVTITGDELLVMDSKDKNTAQKVWRWNLNGLGYSGNGYKGSFTTAMTMDGQIVGERIVGGTITGEKLDIRYRRELDQKISSAENSANGYTDEKLNDYYTKSEVEQSISNSKDGILLEAKQYTTTQLQNYSTIDQMNAAIRVASDNINLSVSQKYVTKNQLTGYVTESQMSSAIQLSEKKIDMSVSQKYATKDQVSGLVTESEMNAAIRVASDNINLSVSKKVGKDEIISVINQSAESVKIKAKYIELTGNVTISALSQDALNTIKGYSNQALTDAKNYTEQQLNSVKSDTGNLLKGYNFTQSDISNYWVTSGSILYGIADPAGGMNAVRVMGTGSDNFISAKRSNNQAIYNTGRYRVSVWLKSNMNRTIKISFNRVTYNCALTNTWKQFTFVQQVNSIQPSYELFTIGGWGSIGANVAVWAFKPEVTFEMTSLDYFNALTNNGETQGLYLSNGKIYINGNYIQAKSISAGKIQVSDLSAFQAKIGGWSIGSNYLRSSNGNVNLYSDGRINIGVATISSYSNAITIKYGLHVYNNTDQFNDGSGYIKFFGLPHVTSGGHLVFNRDGASLAYLSSSSRRYKDPVSDMSVSEAEKILDIPVVWFKYKDGYLRYDDVLAGKAIPGFYAEDVETYYPVAVQRNEDGSVEDWNYRMMIPAMLKLIQELYKRTGGITK